MGKELTSGGAACTDTLLVLQSAGFGVLLVLQSVMDPWDPSSLAGTSMSSDR